MLVDTSVWSLAFRRKQEVSHPAVDQLREVISSGHAIFYTGIILAELLQGVRSETLFKQIEKQFDVFNYIQLTKQHYVSAARLSLVCRQKGIGASTIDLIISAAAIEQACILLTTDKDFDHIASISALKLLKPE